MILDQSCPTRENDEIYSRASRKAFHGRQCLRWVLWDEWEFVLGNKMEKGVGAKGKLSIIGPCVHILV